MTTEPTTLTCRAIDAPGHLTDPWCGLPAAPESLKWGDTPLCSDHLEQVKQHEIREMMS